MAGGGGQGGSGGGLLQDLFKPLLTGKGDPLGVMPEDVPVGAFLSQAGQLPTMSTPQQTDRLAFMKAFGLQG